MIRHPRATPAPTAIAIGSFDGVHRGHAAILDRVVAEALARGLTPAVLTFEPLPREFFSPKPRPRGSLRLRAAEGHRREADPHRLHRALRRPLRIAHARGLRAAPARAIRRALGHGRPRFPLRREARR
jgi:riboflavin kinase/FMN adenylyltransferase